MYDSTKFARRWKSNHSFQEAVAGVQPDGAELSQILLSDTDCNGVSNLTPVACPSGRCWSTVHVTCLLGLTYTMPCTGHRAAIQHLTIYGISWASYGVGKGDFTSMRTDDTSTPSLMCCSITCWFAYLKPLLVGHDLSYQ